MASGRKEPRPEIPNLVLDGPLESRERELSGRSSARPTGPSRPPLAPPVPSREDHFGSTRFDDDDFGEQAPALALDVDPFEVRKDVSDPDPFQPSIENAQGTSQRAAEPDRRRWPTARTPDSASLRIATSEIELVADYGPPPSSVLGAAAYAARVLRRQRWLRVRVKEL